MRPGKRANKKNEISNDSGYNVKSLDMYRTSDTYKKRRTGENTQNKSIRNSSVSDNNAGYEKRSSSNIKNGAFKKNAGKKIKVNRIKRKRMIYSKKTIALFLAVSIAAMSAFFFLGLLMYRYSLVSDMKYEINTLNNTLSQIRNQKKELEVELETTNRSEGIEQIAVDVLKMQYPAEEKIVYIKVD